MECGVDIVLGKLPSSYRIVLSYALFSTLWIIISDNILAMLVSSPYLQTTLQTMKGWGFVLVTSGYLFSLISYNMEKYQRSESKLTLALSSSPTVNYQLIKQGDIFIPIWASNNIQRIMGYSLTEVMEKNWWFSNLHPNDRLAASSFANKLMSCGSFVHEYRFRNKSGDYLWVRDELRLDKTSDSLKVYGCWTNITKEKNNLDQIKLNSTVLNNISNGVIIFQIDGTVITVNKAFTLITGHTKEDAVNQNLTGLFRRQDEQKELKLVLRNIIKNGTWEGEIKLSNQSGETKTTLISIGNCFYNSTQTKCYYAVLTDVTDLKNKEQSLQRLAHFDPLTGAPNRTSMYIDLEILLSNAHGGKEQVAVLFLDLDRFKLINDSKGHSVGDEVLTIVASRLQQVLPDNAKLYRFGGDEFVIVLSQFHLRTEIKEVINVLTATLKSPVKLKNKSQINIKTSIGVSIYPEDGENYSDLLRNADAAMYQAKQGGGNKYLYYNKVMTIEANKSLIMEYELSKAVKCKELHILYQPVIDIQSGKVIGAEALLRWDNPNLGLISPANFVPLAEDTGLILEIGSWVIENVIKQIADWLQAGINPGLIAINVSVNQINLEFCETILDWLAKYNVPSYHIELELTESTLIDSESEVKSILESLRENGINLAIDDFGTGYSSLSYLQDYPINKLKIDRRFVKDIDCNRRSQDLVKAIVAMAHALCLDVQAEGIETQYQQDYISMLGCDYWQGYHFSKPVSPDKYRKIIRS